MNVIVAGPSSTKIAPAADSSNEDEQIGRGWRKALGWYALAVTLCTVFLTWVLRLWSADLRVPFRNTGDVMFNQMITKGIIENGWYLYNPRVGTPKGLYLLDYPFFSTVHLLGLKLFSFFTADFGMVLNLYFLVSFPLITVSTLFVFRQFRVSFPPALVGSLLFTFLPYHFIRGENHLILTSYYLVPVMVLVVFWVCSEVPLFYELRDERLRFSPLTSRSFMGLAIAMLIGALEYVYYPFLTAVFLIVVGVVLSVNRRRSAYFWSSLIVIAGIVIGLAISISPNLIHMSKNGRNPQIANRPWQQSELYGLKIAQLLLPVDGHRLAPLAARKNRYNSTALLVNENRTASLGVFGSVGFLFLICCLLYGEPLFKEYLPEERIKTLKSLSLLNGSAVLLATIGGFGSILAFTVLPQIRAYNRASVFIAFFSIFAIVILLDSVKLNSKKARSLFLAFLAVALVIGILDQTSSDFVPPYDALKAEFRNDANFVERIESKVPPSSMIYQLPYFPFPEVGGINDLGDYQLFKGYLHSDTLRWSYGSIKGRKADRWLQSLAQRPIEAQMKIVSRSGFSGVYIDRLGFSGRGVKLESKIARLTGEKPIVSGDGRMSFFSLLRFKKRIE